MKTLLIAAFAVALTACVNTIDDNADGAVDDGRDVGVGDRDDGVVGVGVGDRDPIAVDPIDDVDDAVVVGVTFPDALACGATATAIVTVQNSGTTTWTRDAGYGLGGVDDSDPFSAARVELADADVVAPGDTHAFSIALTAPDADGQTLSSDWRMVHELVTWFGATTSHDVAIACAPPPPPPQDFDFTMSTIMNSPDISTWDRTAKITRLDLAPDGVHVDFTKRDGPDSWPDVPFGAPGDSLEYTLWIVINIDGQWYASGCIEYWRGLDKNGGPPTEYAMNWYYDSIRWGAMVGHQPAAGETVGFLVTAGDARNNGDALVHERSDVVFVPFPADNNGAAYNF